MTDLPEILANIFSIQRFSTEDGPGIRTTVFFKGCPMYCPWCHNPEALRVQPDLVWHGGRCIGHGECVVVCPEDALTAGSQGIEIDRDRCNACAACVDVCPSAALELQGRTVPVHEIFDDVSSDAGFYETSGGGVTLSGGEPMSQPQAAIDLMRRLRDAKIHVALDTCGVSGGDALAEALPLADLVLFDVKCTDPKKHEEFTGVSFERVAEGARTVNASGVPVWVRTPIIPGYTDDEREVRSVARFVAETFAHCERHDLLAFSNLCTSKYKQLCRDFPLEDAPLMEAAIMEQLCTAAIEEGSQHAVWSGPTRIEKAST